MGLFLSTTVNKVDRKGRVSVPAPFRATLSTQSFAGIVLFPSFTLPCIEGCGMDYMERLSESTEGLAVFSPEQDDITSLIFANSHPLNWDQDGRILLPEDLLAHAGITETAAFVGKGKVFQIWEPSAFKTSQAEIRSRAQQSPPTLRLSPTPRPTNGGGS